MLTAPLGAVWNAFISFARLCSALHLPQAGRWAGTRSSAAGQRHLNDLLDRVTSDGPLTYRDLPDPVGTPVTISAAAAKTGSPLTCNPRRHASTSLTWCGSRLASATTA